jgi:hypothetical protein
MVQWVLQGAATVNQMQTMLLAMEGCVLCIVAFGYMWHLSMTVASQRYTIYSVFLAVPSGMHLVGVSCSHSHAVYVHAPGGLLQQGTFLSEQCLLSGIGPVLVASRGPPSQHIAKSFVLCCPRHGAPLLLPDPRPCEDPGHQEDGP